jgi:hypothetical protein
MTTIDLKNILIHKISGINDKDFLNAIKTIIEAKEESIIYKTNSEQRKRILEGKKQIAKGEYFSNDQVETYINKWLKEK